VFFEWRPDDARLTVFSFIKSRLSYPQCSRRIAFRMAHTYRMDRSTESETAERRAAALAEAEGLIDRLHAEAEAHKAGLARAIHDDLCGLLLSAAMDFTSARRRLPKPDPPIVEQLDRGRQSLESAINLSRRMVEDLRPSILDNFGLLAALKWQLKQASEGSGATLTESYPTTEPDLQPAALIALFRVAQEAIGMIFKRSSVGAASIELQTENQVISMRFTDDGIPDTVGGLEVGAASAMTSMKHRIRALGGTVELKRTEAGGSVLTAYLPLPEGVPVQR
jgi:signal transduction histidine kinase